MTTTKHTLTSAVGEAEAKQESGDYHVGTFFEDDPATENRPLSLHITYDAHHDDAYVGDAAHTDAEIVLEIGDHSDYGDDKLLQLGTAYREMAPATWGNFIELLRRRGATIDALWVEDEDEMAQGTLYVAVPSEASILNVVTYARGLVLDHIQEQELWRVEDDSPEQMRTLPIWCDGYKADRVGIDDVEALHRWRKTAAAQWLEAYIDSGHNSWDADDAVIERWGAYDVQSQDAPTSEHEARQFVATLAADAVMDVHSHWSEWISGEAIIEENHLNEFDNQPFSAQDYDRFIRELEDGWV